ncbi:hypothetical protein [Faecalibaculum rodentium]|uniref:hypothetical protein n=1 Tax=Faecalibaculum rodentium TaxID=1702221 RepID=UPI001F5A59BF|nr:hypothetical protein [Faecalibaculum rodentium]
MAEHSGFHHLRPALMAAMLLMAGCAAPATVSDGSSSIQQDRTSETADRPDSGDRQAGDGTESAGASSADVQGLETEGASVLLADLKEEAVQAWEAQGFVPADTSGDPQDQATELRFESQDQPVLVQITLSDNAAQVFDTQCRLDEENNMQVMNEWQDGSRTVRVIRNNRANQNFIETLDTDRHVTMHIANTLPEQLDLSLQALGSLGWPVDVSQ